MPSLEEFLSNPPKLEESNRDISRASIPEKIRQAITLLGECQEEFVENHNLCFCHYSDGEDCLCYWDNSSQEGLKNKALNDLADRLENFLSGE